MNLKQHIEEQVAELRLAMRTGCECKSCKANRENIGPDCVIRQTLTSTARKMLEADIERLSKSKIDEAGEMKVQMGDGSITKIPIHSDRHLLYNSAIEAEITLKQQTLNELNNPTI